MQPTFRVQNPIQDRGLSSTATTEQCEAALNLLIQHYYDPKNLDPEKFERRKAVWQAHIDNSSDSLGREITIQHLDDRIAGLLDGQLPPNRLEMYRNAVAIERHDLITAINKAAERYTVNGKNPLFDKIDQLNMPQKAESEGIRF